MQISTVHITARAGAEPLAPGFRNNKKPESSGQGSALHHRNSLVLDSPPELFDVFMAWSGGRYSSDPIPGHQCHKLVNRTGEPLTAAVVQQALQTWVAGQRPLVANNNTGSPGPVEDIKKNIFERFPKTGIICTGSSKNERADKSLLLPLVLWVLDCSVK